MNSFFDTDLMMNIPSNYVIGNNNYDYDDEDEPLIDVRDIIDEEDLNEEEEEEEEKKNYDGYNINDSFDEETRNEAFQSIDEKYLPYFDNNKAVLQDEIEDENKKDDDDLYVLNYFRNARLNQNEKPTRKSKKPIIKQLCFYSDEFLKREKELSDYEESEYHRKVNEIEERKRNRLIIEVK